MSSTRASLVSRIEDYLLRALRKLTPGLSKLMMVYVAEPNTENIEREILKRFALCTVKAYMFFESLEDKISALPQVARRVPRCYSSTESKVLSLYKTFIRGLASIQASLEDIVSFSSSYMSLLFIVSMLCMVVTAWTLHLLLWS